MESVWLTINQMAALFQMNKSGISRHLKNVFASGELEREATVASFATVAAGLTVSDVVRVLMTRIAEDKAIPLELFRPKAETLAAFAEIERGGLKRFNTVDDLFEDLNADDWAYRPVQKGLQA